MITDDDLKYLQDIPVMATGHQVAEMCGELLKLRSDNRWIPVSERLPEFGETDPFNFMPSEVVLMLGKDKCIWLARYDGKWNNANSSDKVWMDTDYATHWRPLPAPPEAE